MSEEDIKKYKPISGCALITLSARRWTKPQILVHHYIAFALSCQVFLPVPMEKPGSLFFFKPTNCKYAKHAEVPFLLFCGGATVRCFSISLVKIAAGQTMVSDFIHADLSFYVFKYKIRHNYL